ncbi:MAG: hypothetical protein ABR608_14460 [Pseudonocardiaceae bacterium]
MRDRYDAPYENESLRKFLVGEPDNLPWMQSWLTTREKCRGMLLPRQGGEYSAHRLQPLRCVVCAVHQPCGRGYPLPYS